MRASSGLAESSDGILILPEGSATPGTLFVAAFPAAQDTIYELDVTPNRPDALGHVGLARELAGALPELQFTPPAAGTPMRTSSQSLAALVQDRQSRHRALPALQRRAPCWM